MPDVNLTASGSNPYVLWDVDSSTANDWQIQATSGTLIMRVNSASWTEIFELNSTGVTTYRDLHISASAPKLTFEDTGGSVDFRMMADDGVLSFKTKSGTVYTDRLQVSETQTTAFDTLLVAGAEPTLELHDTTASPPEASFQLRASGGIFYLERVGGQPVLQLNTDTDVAYFPRAIAAGHDAEDAGSANHAFRVKRFSGTAPASPTTSMNIALGAEMLGDVIGALFMMSKGGTPAVYDTYGYREASSNGFFVQVIPGSSPTTQDSVLVTFDASYNNAPYILTAFFKFDS